MKQEKLRSTTKTKNASPMLKNGKNIQYSREIYAIFASIGVMGKQYKEFMSRHPERNPLNGIDIKSEYEKIQNKTSNLSRHHRDLVCFMIEHEEEIQQQIKDAEKKDAEKLNAI